MKIIISPAKKMNYDSDSLAPLSQPQFLDKTEVLLKTLRNMGDAELQSLWRCNDSLATLNCERVRSMNLREGLTPALLSYEGIQYRYMAANVFEDGHYDYLQTHLRILSGFYGILRPFDGVTPYRLELGAKLSVGDSRNLYDFWGNVLSETLCEDCDCILNLASKEYSRAISAHIPKSVRFCTVTFAEKIGDKLVEKGTMCKMARGQMVRYMAENSAKTPEQILEFSDLGYGFSEAHSSADNLVFLKGEA